MTIKNKITYIFFSVALIAVSLVSFSIPQKVYADASVTCTDGTTATVTQRGATPSDADYKSACGSHGYTAPASGSGSGSGSTDTTNPLDTLKCDTTGEQGICTGQNEVTTSHTCGKGTDGNGNSLSVKVSFDFGCRGESYTCPAANPTCSLNPIIDVLFAIFRVASAGVGIVVIGSIIIAGIQYAASRGNPQSTEAAIKRISNALIGLLVYIFMFAIANFIVPGGMFL